jgi:hypothetical protein
MKLVDQLRQNPWRFKAGDEVWIAGNQQPYPAKVVEAFGYGPSGWPHYLVVDVQGDEWTVPQQLLSKVPIPT